MATGPPRYDNNIKFDIVYVCGTRYAMVHKMGNYLASIYSVNTHAAEWYNRDYTYMKWIFCSICNNCWVLWLREVWQGVLLGCLKDPPCILYKDSLLCHGNGVIISLYVDCFLFVLFNANFLIYCNSMLIFLQNFSYRNFSDNFMQ